MPDTPPSGLDGRVRLVAGGERNFDLSVCVNFAGGRNVLKSVRGRAGAPRGMFANSIATFGGTLTEAVSDTTKQTPETTYGMTKVIGELMVNNYSRKGVIDGRTVRLPTVIVRPGKANAELRASPVALSVNH
ncbi:MAG TPA: NAD-dependent epimerase/dehydratase family protein [Rhodospirillales bacterium]|nr:NAD-dependent epimerase/dehydratase family protein [Rhodospirillales bacterium]